MKPAKISPRLSFGLPVTITASLNDLELEVTGTPGDIDAWPASYKTRYGWGYNVTVDSDHTKQGVRVVCVSRLGSCG